MGKTKGASPGRIPASEESPAQKPAPPARLTAIQQGNLGEVAFLHKATSLGFIVTSPWGYGHPYDFIVDTGQYRWRVQVKVSSFLINGFYEVTASAAPGADVIPTWSPKLISSWRTLFPKTAGTTSWSTRMVRRSLGSGMVSLAFFQNELFSRGISAASMSASGASA